jgi:methylated-DNA-[protein]-cysteine S-methyltransferase
MKKIYKILMKVPAGRVTTYKELGRASGYHHRAVGKLMNVNPYAPRVPCHRVVMSDGSIGGFGDKISKKIALLKKEGVKVRKGKIVDFEKKFYKFKI